MLAAGWCAVRVLLVAGGDGSGFSFRVPSFSFLEWGVGVGVRGVHALGAGFFRFSLVICCFLFPFSFSAPPPAPIINKRTYDIYVIKAHRAIRNKKS